MSLHMQKKSHVTVILQWRRTMKRVLCLTSAACCALFVVPGFVLAQEVPIPEIAGMVYDSARNAAVLVAGNETWTWGAQ